MKPKLPPHAPEAEMSVLGGLMLDNRGWIEICDRLTPEDFYTEAHRLIFAAIAALLDSGQPVDIVTVTNWLKARNQIESVGGQVYLYTLVNETPGASNILAYADIVRRESIYRAMIAASADIMGMAYDPGDRSNEEILDVAEHAIFSVRERGQKGLRGQMPMFQIIPQVVEQVDLAFRNPGGVRGLATGLTDLDQLTTGLHPGDLVIVAGRPGSGKTSLAMNFAEHASVRNGGHVLVFSMEMPSAQLGMRLLASCCRISLKSLRDGRMTDADWARLAQGQQPLQMAPLYVDDTGALSPQDLRARARRAAQRRPLDLMVVDYIQLMQVHNTKDNRTNEISKISRDLKALAKELKVPIIAISQLSRSVEQRDDKRPRMSDLRDSGGIEQDADIILFVYRDDYYNEDSTDRGIAELIIAKQRNGETGKVRVRYTGMYTRFDNLDTRHDGYHGPELYSDPPEA